MKIAYYGVGNVKDPLGIIHDEQGKIILEQNESILTKIIVKHCHIYMPRTSDWGSFFAKIVFDDTGEITIYRTNRRLVGIREPSPFQHLGRGSEGSGGGAFFVGPPWAREWKKLGRKESFSLPLDEIVVFRNDGCPCVFMRDEKGKEKRYVVVIGVDKTTISQLLGDILKDKPVLR